MLLHNKELDVSFRYVLDKEGNPWFKANEVATKFAYKDTAQAIRDNVEIENVTTVEDLIKTNTLNEVKGTFQPCAVNRVESIANELDITTSNYMKTKLINEDGIMDLIFVSKLPHVRDYRRWIKFALKSIRINCSYTIYTFN